MGLIELAVALGVAIRASVRRVFAGPLRPGWSWSYEVRNMVARALVGRAAADHKRLRRLMTPVSVATLQRQGVRFTTLEVAGRQASMATVAPAADDEAANCAVLYLHGGAYVAGSPDSHLAITGGLAATAGVPVVGLDYRLAPEHPYPAALDDTLLAIDQMLDHGGEPRRLLVAGDSAGGGLAALATLARRDRRQAPLAGAVLISPWADLTCDQVNDQAIDYLFQDGLRAWGRQFAGDLALADAQVSPLSAELSGLPPLLIVAGGDELLRPDSERLAAAASAAGVDVTLHVEPHEIHVYPAFAKYSPRAQAALAMIGAFVRARFGLPAVAAPAAPADAERR